MDYDKERATWYGMPPISPRCTRNMPLETNTIGTDKVIDYAENAPTPAHWRCDDPVKQTKPTTGIDMNKYQRKLTNPNIDWGEVTIDVYDVLNAYNVDNPATAHAIKKLLCTGSRGLKDWETDLQEAIDSLERAKSFPPIPF